MIKLVQSTMVPLKFWTKDCAHAAQTFSPLAHHDGAQISWRWVIILVSAGFQPNATQQDYPLDWAPQHAMKIKRSQRSNSIEMKKENHLFYVIESWDRQVTCSERKLRLQKTKQINASERNSGADHNPKNPLIEGAILARYLQAPRHQAQRPHIARACHMDLQRWTKKNLKGSSIFSF